MRLLQRKKRTLFQLLTPFILLLLIGNMSTCIGFAENTESLDSQGTSSFFGKYEKPNPSPDPAPSPGIVPNNSESAQEQDNNQRHGLLPHTGTRIEYWGILGIVLLLLSFYIFIRNTKKKHEE